MFYPEEVSVGEVIYPPGGTFGPRLQRNLQLVMLHSGQMTIWIDERTHYVSANTVLVLLPGHTERFAFAEDRETHHSWLHAYMPHLESEFIMRLQRLDWPLQLTSTMNQLLQDALTIQVTPFPTASEILKALAIEMLWRYIGEGEQRRTQSTIQTHPAVQQAQQYISAHLSELITLEMLADIVAVSPAHLIRLFQAQLHITPMAYVWQQRVNVGVKLLEQTGLPVGIIAERCGFQSRFHFSRRIRQCVGSPPLEVRNRSWKQK